MRVTMNFLIAAFALAGCGLSPAEAVVVARRDIETLPAEIRPYVRYLSLGELAPEARGDAARVLSGHVNGLSCDESMIEGDAPKMAIGFKGDKP